MKPLIAFLILVSCGLSYSEDLKSMSDSTKPTYVMCKNKAVVRTIRIESKKNHCQTTYSKDGVETVVGRSGTAELCHEVFRKIKDNLEKADWKCRDITQSRVSSSAE